MAEQDRDESLWRQERQEVQKNATEIFRLFEEHNPAPSTELVYNNDFTLLIAVILSAQATDASVNKVMTEIMERVDSPQKIIELTQDGFATFIRTLNIYKNKAKYIYELSTMLIEQYEAKVPLILQELIKLPGVGRKTANVVLNVLTGGNGIAVDTHVLRVSRRLGIASENTPEKVEQELYCVVPKQFWEKTNHWLVLHGRYTCKAKKPMCSDCFLRAYCQFFKRQP
ncbi:MAG: endonuclease III [Holosporales bacterium]|jgi:endonuclease-3|nr:endonuclease III [Holosporales bacterium]